jgi:hypothetical protein
MIMFRAKLALAFVAALAVTSAQHTGVFGARKMASLSRNLEEDVCVTEVSIPDVCVAEEDVCVAAHYACMHNRCLR